MFDRLEDLVLRLEEILNQLSEPDVVSDTERFRNLMKEQSELTPIVETYKEYKQNKQNIEESLMILEEENDEEMRELAKEELNASKANVEELEGKLKILLLPKDPNDDKNVIVEIRAGAGGDEAALFAAEIYRMYVHYAEGRRWKIETMECEEIGIGGMKSVTFMITGQGAYSVMKYESGVHRVQRVPETESGGRIHTSTISVAVMPEAEEVEVEIDEKDIRIDVMRASGNGGQCVNTTDSAVRLTHNPTGIVIYSQTEKSQLQNKAKAFALLRAKLYDIECQKAHDAEAEARRSQIGTGDRSEKIRTYNFPQGRVTDHRIGLTLYKLDKIMDGDIQEIIDACLAADQAAKLSKLNEEAMF
ncbi:MAG: peptide chain release factor 1 [Lachnospiraceae bacterium]|nr:peptide chain release factor 1 [Lachnospiraceae bacterium]